MAQAKAKIFISYSRVDEAFARQLAGSLSAMGADVWIDVEDIPAGLKWSSAIQQGLDVCDALLVIISPESMASNNVEDEWQYFLDQKRPVFPIQYRPAKTHFQLSRIQYVDFARQSYEQAILQLNAELRRRAIVVQPILGAEAPRPQPPLSTTTQPIAAPAPAHSRTPLLLGIGAAGLVAAALMASGVFSNPPPVPTPTAMLTTTEQVAVVPSSTVAPLLTATSLLTQTSSFTPTITLTASRTRRGTPVPPTELALTQAVVIDTQVAQAETDDALATETAFALTDDVMQQTLDSYTDTPTPNFPQTVAAARTATRAARTQAAAATQTQNAIISPTPVPTLTPNAMVCAGTPPTRLNAGMRAMVPFISPGGTNDNVNVRVQPGTGSEAVVALSPGRLMYITGQPQCADGYIWYPVQTQNAPIISGWVAEGGFASSEIEYYIEPFLAGT